MGKEEIAAQRGQQGDEETQQHDQARPEREDAILHQDNGDREIEAKIRLAIGDLSELTERGCATGNLSIKYIGDDADEKYQQCQPARSTQPANESGNQVRGS